MSSFQQHDQGLGAQRSNKITHMTPGISGVVRQAQAPIKKPVLGDEDSGEEDEDEDETERSPQFFQGFEDEDEEREGVCKGVGPGPEPSANRAEPIRTGARGDAKVLAAVLG